MKRRKTVAQLTAMCKRVNRLEKTSSALYQKYIRVSDKTHEVLVDVIDQVTCMYEYWEDKGNNKKMNRYASEIRQIEKLISNTH